jgi:ABC-2 type transport system ATP-binding protein
LRRAGAHLDPADDGFTVQHLTATEVGKLAAAEGIALTQLTTRRGSLEDVFMAITGDAVEYGVRA